MLGTLVSWDVLGCKVSTFGFAFSGQPRSCILLVFFCILKIFDRIDTCLGTALTCVLGRNGGTMRNCALLLSSALRFLLCEIMSEMDDIEEFPKAAALLRVRDFSTSGRTHVSMNCSLTVG